MHAGDTIKLLSLLKFPREVLHIACPVPLDPGSGTSVQTGSGRVFDDVTSPEQQASARLPWSDVQARRRQAQLVCERLFADSRYSGDLEKIGRERRQALTCFLTILRVECRQYLLPEALPLASANNQWVVGDGTQRAASPEFVARLLKLQKWNYADEPISGQAIRAAEWTAPP